MEEVNKKYNVVFTGGFLSGFFPLEVKKNIIQDLRLTATEQQQFFSDKAFTILKAVQLERAKRLQKELLEKGLMVSIVSCFDSDDLQIPVNVIKRKRNVDETTMYGFSFIGELDIGRFYRLLCLNAIMAFILMILIPVFKSTAFEKYYDVLLTLLVLFIAYSTIRGYCLRLQNLSFVFGLSIVKKLSFIVAILTLLDYIAFSIPSRIFVVAYICIFPLFPFLIPGRKGKFK